MCNPKPKSNIDKGIMNLFWYFEPNPPRNRLSEIKQSFHQRNLRPAGGDPGRDHLQNIFLTVFVFLEWTWPFWNPWKTFNETNVWFKQRKTRRKLFLPWRHSALLVRPVSWLAKNRRQGKPCQYARDQSVRYSSLCPSKLLSPALPVSLVPPRGLESVRKPLKTKFTPAVSSVYSLSLSLSLSLSPREHHSRKRIVSAQHSWSKQKFAQSLSSKFILSSLDFAFNMWKSNCRAGRGQRRCYSCGIENEARGSSADWPAPADVAECCHQIQVSRAHTAGSGWFKRKKSSEPFRGIQQCGAAFGPTTWLLNGGNFCWVRVTATFQM